MFDFEKRLAEIGRQTVLCIGDLMLDDFVYGDVSRISPEAPAPVIRVSREDVVVGGAGNVARNIASLGADALFVGVVGNDSHGRNLQKVLAQQSSGITARLVVDKSRPTTRKLRFVSEHHSTHLLRADWEVASPVDAEDRGRADQARAGAAAAGRRGGAVGLRQGRADAEADPRRDRAGEEARQAGDRRSQGHRFFDLSRRDHHHAEPQGAGRGDATCRSARIDEVAAAAQGAGAAVGSKAVLVTLSEEGMLLYARGAEPVHVPAYSVKVRDVSGAGDTVAAVLAVMLGAGRRFRVGDARRQCGGVRRGRQARHRDGLAVGAARAHPAVGDARRRGKDRLRLARASMRGSANGARRTCASASPTACSTCCIPATSRCWRSRAPPATGWWSASTATPRCGA